MKQTDLTEQELLFLDITLNLGRTSKGELAGFYVGKEVLFDSKQVDDIIQRLKSYNLISVKEEQYRVDISIDPEMALRAREILEPVWESRAIREDTLSKHMESEFASILKLLEIQTSYEGKDRFGFSDYFYDNTLIALCERLAREGFLFKHVWLSRKHSYTDFHLRSVPFSIGGFLRNFVVERIDPEKLREAEWRALIPCVFSNQTITLDDIRSNLFDMTNVEVDEMLAGLESRGILSRDKDALKISAATRELVKQYFIVKEYPAFKGHSVAWLRKRVGEMFSNLYLIGVVKKILTSVAKPSREPYVVVERSLLGDVEEDDLKEAAKLGLVFLGRGEVIVAHDVLSAVEDILRFAMSEASDVIRVPARDEYYAMTVWKSRIFPSCEEYVKIQDEFVDDSTLMLIKSYANPKLQIKILSSLEKARQAEVDDMKRVLADMKKQGFHIEWVLVGYEGKYFAPFHFRYIISREACFSLSHSIRQIGKEKDSDIKPLTRHEKEGVVEPAFNYWFSDVSEKELKEEGIVRMSFDEWSAQESKSL